ncbi:Sec-independent protein translocase protein TatB [Marinomonas transparens]|uniref:Sec-independent protein translocase protein TatB n=1 Tax=Marinomonas transparens TaxID=2795388 RepID=A0A934JV56_9GAMM|nr:Sec-independent protein translocase protein TatB [Marinomonas transparens]MBJ7537844.1 twin-arginine translocase subunit TatB [Marinomonas transparens]
MFDIGLAELLVVFVVGLLILGPERLPHAAKTAGLWIRKIRRSINSVQREINAQLDQEELQQKINETNQRIMKEGEVIQNTITPLPEVEAELPPVNPSQQEQDEKHLFVKEATQAEENIDETSPIPNEKKASDANLSRP